MLSVIFHISASILVSIYFLSFPCKDFQHSNLFLFHWLLCSSILRHVNFLLFVSLQALHIQMQPFIHLSTSEVKSMDMGTTCLPFLIFHSLFSHSQVVSPVVVLFVTKYPSQNISFPAFVVNPFRCKSLLTWHDSQCSGLWIEVYPFIWHPILRLASYLTTENLTHFQPWFSIVFSRITKFIIYV